MTQPDSIDRAQPRNSGRECGIVRKATREDLPGIVTIHQRAFPHFFLTHMGGGFLRRYYGLVLRYGGGIFLVSETARGLEGFVCGFLDPGGFYGLWSRSRRGFLLPILWAVVRRPALITRIAAGLKRVSGPPPERTARTCELASVAVRPDAGGSGLGTALVKAFLGQAWTLGAESVYLETDAAGNEPANAFYRRLGFRLAGRTLKYKDRWMNQYRIDRRKEEGLSVVHEKSVQQN